MSPHRRTLLLTISLPLALVISIAVLAAMISKAHWGYYMHPPTLGEMLDRHASSVQFDRRHILSGDPDPSGQLIFSTAPGYGTTVSRLNAAAQYPVTSPFGGAVTTLESLVPESMTTRDAELESHLQSIMSEEFARLYQSRPPWVSSGSPLWGMAAAGRDAESGSIVVAATMKGAPIDAKRSPCWLLVFKVDELGEAQVLGKRIFYHGKYGEVSLMSPSMLLALMAAAASVIIFIAVALFGSGHLLSNQTATIRRQRGLCVSCGYDIQSLKGTRTPCPECGRRIPKM